MFMPGIQLVKCLISSERYTFGHVPRLWAFVHVSNSAVNADWCVPELNGGALAHAASAAAGFQSLIGAYRAVGIVSWHPSRPWP
jgi:hypothetical protein